MFPSVSVLLVAFACAPGLSVQGRTETTFVVDAPLSEVVYKLDTMESLRRAFRSQGIDLLGYKWTKRKLNLWTQTLDAEATIQCRAPKISPTVGFVRQLAQVGLNRATIDFTLQAPVGLLAEQQYVLEFEAKQEQTQIRIQMGTRVNVPWGRVRVVRHLMSRIARRRVAKEINRNRANLQREITRIIAEARPRGEPSVLFP